MYIVRNWMFMHLFKCGKANAIPQNKDRVQDGYNIMHTKIAICTHWGLTVLSGYLSLLLIMRSTYLNISQPL